VKCEASVESVVQFEVYNKRDDMAVFKNYRRFPHIDSTMAHSTMCVESSAVGYSLGEGDNHRAGNDREDQKAPSASNAIVNETEQTRRALQHTRVCNQ
jgi:hypothetical protein